MEWEILSLNVSRHPLSPYRSTLAELETIPSEEVKKLLHGTRARAAGFIECLQSPPTKSGKPVYFLVIEDEWALLQATIFRPVYERYGHLLHPKGASLLEGRVEQSPNKGFSFSVERIEDLREVLAGMPAPTRAVPSSGSFLRTRRKGRRAG
jgi:DNA polymerase III alpha subunit